MLFQDFKVVFLDFFVSLIVTMEVLKYLENIYHNIFITSQDILKYLLSFFQYTAESISHLAEAILEVIS